MDSESRFTKEQQAYLQGLVLGSDVARKVRSLPVMSGSAAGDSSTASDMKAARSTIDKGYLTTLHALAHERCIAAGGKLVDEEIAKRNKDALEGWGEIKARSERGEYPKGTDVFLTKYFGLFYVAPAQNSFMCRMRIPGGELRSYQLIGLAKLADRLAAGHVDITTRANLQMREIAAEHASEVLMELRDLGIVTLGAGADNIRNVTCSPLSGIDSCELIETLPLAREMHFHILHRKELFGLPRKFNIAFDGGGKISSLAETNDICWQAIEINSQPASPTHASLSPGVYFELRLGGITGHGDFARPTSVVVAPKDCISVSEAILRVFIGHGDRTDRKKARLKYLLDSWGIDKFISEVEKELGRSLDRVPIHEVSTRDQVDRWAHVGVHPQKQSGLEYVGVVVPAGRLMSHQLCGLAKIADRFADGKIRLTVWQNFLIPNIRHEDMEQVKEELEALGLDWNASSFQAGLVACTGNAGCKYAASDTKRHAQMLAGYLQSRFQLEHPINIHLTGCHHSCAQHAIGDIGLIATKVEVLDDLVEGYHVLVGGRTGSDAQIGRLICRSVPAESIPQTVASIIEHYLEHRHQGVSFAEFAATHDWSMFDVSQEILIEKVMSVGESM